MNSLKSCYISVLLYVLTPLLINELIGEEDMREEENQLFLGRDYKVL